MSQIGQGKLRGVQEQPRGRAGTQEGAEGAQTWREQEIRGVQDQSREPGGCRAKVRIDLEGGCRSSVTEREQEPRGGRSVGRQRRQDLRLRTRQEPIEVVLR